MPESQVEFATRPPVPVLRPYVERYFGYRMEGFAPGIHRGLPSRHLTFIATLGAPIDVVSTTSGEVSSFAAVLGGLDDRPTSIRHNGNHFGVSVEVTPLGAPALFGVSAAELRSGIVDPFDLLGRSGARARERLHAATTWEGRFELLDDVLLGVLRERYQVGAELAWAWRSLASSHGNVAVAALAEEVGWSRRHLGGRFRAEFGVSPKTAARVIRFDRSCRLLRARPSRSLADVAAACGYFDQAHLVRDWRQFAGCPPSVWIKEEDLPSLQDETAWAEPD